jgi:hypothetical protein
MRGAVKTSASVVALILVIAFALWCPFPAGSVPEWSLRVVDQSAHALVGAQDRALSARMTGI